ncbi:MAG: hypothetical protein AMXMBFR13_26210, partial [Phycisphaerae bacterium]
PCQPGDGDCGAADRPPRRMGAVVSVRRVCRPGGCGAMAGHRSPTPTERYGPASGSGLRGRGGAMPGDVDQLAAEAG